MHTGMNPPLCPALLFGVDSKGGHKISLKPVPCPVWIYYCTGGHMARDRLHPLMLKELDCADSILSSPCLSVASPVSLHCCSCWQLGWWLLCSSETPPCTTPQREWAAIQESEVEPFKNRGEPSWATGGHRRPVGCSQSVAQSVAQVVWGTLDLAGTEIHFGITAPHFWWWE